MPRPWSMVVLYALSLSSVASAQHAAVECRSAAECRQLALDAQAAGDYAGFHDLAWRAVQSGPPNDPALMSLLARAQVLSGRPHDALVMLRRLAERGVAVDVSNDADFARTRELPDWPAVEALIAKTRGTVTDAGRGRAASAEAAVAPPAVATRPAVATPPAIAAPPAGATSPAVRAPATTTSRAAPSSSAGSPPTAPPAASASSSAVARAVTPLPQRLAPIEEAARFTTDRLTTGGLAYDTVSRRFVLGDAIGRKLIVVGLNGGQPVDMVRAESAGFEEVTALEIDERRGDLWVVSTNRTDGGSALHLLQLVSGRPLRTYRPGAAVQGAQLVDLAVTPAGTVFLLDRARGTILTLARGGSELTLITRLTLASPVSLAATDDEGVLYVAYADGLARVDLRTGTATPVTTPAGVDLARLARLRASGRTLIAVQAAPDGGSQVLRLDLSRNGRAVAEAAIIGTPSSSATPLITISGDDLYYLTDRRGTGPAVTLAVQRLRLR